MSAEARERLAPASYTLFLLLLAYGLTLFGVGPSLLAIARDYGAPLGRMGALYTGFFLGFSLSVLAAGYAAERWGKKPVVQAGLAILGLGALAFGLAPRLGSFGLAVVVMGMVGVGGAAVESVSSALLNDLNPRRSGLALNLSQGFFGIGAVIGPYFVGYLLGHGLSWRIHFYLAAAVMAVLFAVLLAQPVREPEAPRLTLGQLGGILRHPVFMLSAVAMVLYIGAEIGYTGWVSPFLERSLGAGPALASQGVGLFWVGMTIGRMGSGWAADRLGPERLVAVLSIAGAVFCVGTAVAGTALGGLLTALAAGLALSGIFASILTAMGNHFPDRVATVFALIIASVGIGGMTFPAVMGVLGEAAGLRLAMLVPAALLVLLCVTMVRLRGIERQAR